jgi:hypothetical protein
MALADVLSKLEQVLGLLAANPAAPHRVGTEGLFGYALGTMGVSNVRSVVTSSGGLPLSTADRVSQQVPGLGALTPSLSPLSWISFTPAGALADIFSASETRLPTTIQRNEELGQRAGEWREVGINSRSDQGYEIDRNAFGQPRSRSAIAGSEGRSPTQITVNVQTIDSRSFLDHSEDIAHALRRSLLTDNPLGEVL